MDEADSEEEKVEEEGYITELYALSGSESHSERRYPRGGRPIQTSQRSPGKQRKARTGGSEVAQERTQAFTAGVTEFDTRVEGLLGFRSTSRCSRIDKVKVLGSRMAQETSPELKVHENGDSGSRCSRIDKARVPGGRIEPENSLELRVHGKGKGKSFRAITRVKNLSTPRGDIPGRSLQAQDCTQASIAGASCVGEVCDLERKPLDDIRPSLVQRAWVLLE
jgi:hypothetical protein